MKPINDIRAICRAYAQLAARYHLEEYPEQYQEISEAYQTAIWPAGGNLPD